MKSPCFLSCCARITTLVFILPMLAAAALRAGEIHDAVAAGDLNKVRALLEADPTLLESKDDNDDTPLGKACAATQVAVANFLIDKGANVNARNKIGATPLYGVIDNPRKDIDVDLSERLIAKGADVNAKLSTHPNWTIFCGIAKQGNLKKARFLIDHGADINVNTLEGTPLQMVINQSPKEEMAKWLLENGAKLQEFSFGNTELHLAAMRGCADLVPLLVKHGADVNAVNEYGHTPLYYASKHGRRKAADALIAAGANKNAIIETNYGKAPQLSETLKEGEAYLWYLGGGSPCSGYALKTKEHLLIFNPAGIDESPEAGLANGYLNPNELAGQKITVMFTHGSGRRVSKLAKIMPGADFILNSDPTAPAIGGLIFVGDDASDGTIPPYRLATPNESFSMGGIQVHTTAMRRYWPGMEGLGYLVEADGVKIFHAGLHASGNDSLQIVKYRKEIDYLRPFGPIDIAILPIKGRHINPAYEPYLYLLDQLSPKAVYLIGDDLVTEEHRECAEVLRARNIPVAYPEGGIAIGERFHFVRERVSMTPFAGSERSSRRASANAAPVTHSHVYTISCRHGAIAGRFNRDGL